MALRLNGSTSGYVELDAPAVAGTTALTLPDTSGTVATQAYADTAGATLGGLVKIVDASFSTVSSVSVNNCFTSTYDNYKIVVSGVHSSGSGNAVNFRYRSSGSDDAGNNYFWQVLIANNTAISGLRSASTSSAEIGYFAQRDIIEVTLTSPSAVQIKTMISHSSANSTGGLQTLVYSHAYSQTTSSDGFTLLTPAGTITGNVRVYGFRN
jgi:hypothetical protein